MSEETIVLDKIAQNTLLGLPPELRNQIYEYALRDAEGLDINIKRWTPTIDKSWHEPGLLRSCKQIRREALALYYSSNNFVLRASTTELEEFCAWVRIRRSAAEGNFKMRFFLPRASWQEEPNFIHFAHLFRETDIEFGQGWNYALEKFDLVVADALTCGHPYHTPVGVALQAACNMGSAARRDGLTRERLVERFRLWLENEKRNAYRFKKSWKCLETGRRNQMSSKST